MKTSADIRHDNLLALIETAGSIQAVATRLGKDHAQISQLKTKAKHSKSGQPRLIGDDMARLIEEKFGLEIGWMDNPHDAESSDHAGAVIPLRSGGNPWPFKTVSAEEFAAFSDFDRGQIEGFMKGLLHAAQAPKKSNGATR